MPRFVSENPPSHPSSSRTISPSARLQARRRLIVTLVESLAVLCCFTCPVVAASGLAQARVQDLDGHRVTVGFKTNQAALVFVFLSVECPISNSYAPELQRLGREFGSKNVSIALVYPNGDESAQAVRKHLKDFGLPFPAWRDPARDLTKLCQVQITPEAAVFVPKLGLVYHGRIDNRYADLGVARPEATEHDLRDALAAIVSGKPVPHRSTRAVGCSIAPP